MSTQTTFDGETAVAKETSVIVLDLVGDQRRTYLEQSGYETLADLATADVSELAAVHSVGFSRALELRVESRTLLGLDEHTTSERMITDGGIDIARSNDPMTPERHPPAALSDDYCAPYDRAGRWKLTGEWTKERKQLTKRTLRIETLYGDEYRLGDPLDRKWFEHGTYHIFTVDWGARIFAVLAEYNPSDWVTAYHLRYVGALTKTRPKSSTYEPDDERIRQRLGLESGDSR